MKQHFLTMMVGRTPDSRVTTTLCGISAPTNGELNGSDDIKDVTCRLCLQHHENQKSWRWRKYLKRRVIVRAGKNIRHINRAINNASDAGLA